jgi:hypothetical protein
MERPLDESQGSSPLQSHISWLMCEVALRGASHYGRRSRGHRFPPIKLQETKSLASRPFALYMAKVQRMSQFKMITFEEGDGLSKEVWVGREWKPKLWSRDRRFFFMRKSIIDNILAIRLEGYFEQGIKWDVPLGLGFGLGLWRLHTMPGQRLHLLYFIGYFQLISLDFQQSLVTHSHGLSTWTAIE